jgi:hypothetical protein
VDLEPLRGRHLGDLRGVDRRGGRAAHLDDDVDVAVGKDRLDQRLVDLADVDAFEASCLTVDAWSGGGDARGHRRCHDQRRCAERGQQPSIHCSSQCL